MVLLLLLLESLCPIVNMINIFNIHSKPLEYYYTDDFRKPVIASPSKSIILAGCSFTYGHRLNDDETFGYILSKYSNRTVYNLGITGGSLRDFLFILRNKSILYKLIPEKNPDIEYIIYTYIPDSEGRLYYNLRETQPFFIKSKNNTLKYIKINKLFNGSNTYRQIMRLLYSRRLLKNTHNLYLCYLKECKKELSKLYPNAKFIILAYENDNQYGGVEE